MSERIEQAVIAEQQAKISLGKALEEAVEAEGKAEAAFKEAKAETVKARRAALRGGWDEKSLRKLGLLKTSRVSKKTDAAQEEASTEAEHGRDSIHQH
ncbi:hypothetical protein [Paenarthrobacter ureafaciens]|uniref:hypothetical protein n=1 Tax=Paenarthrobacter ureafaciens TaxID=37931 RepID=UPI0011196CCC|nr:hypothetical protein [Paenarthrobacter ureafaciens]